MLAWSRRTVTGVTIVTLVIALATMGGYRLSGSSTSSQGHTSLAASRPDTWVSAMGNDANRAAGCPRSSPCSLFGVAVTVTDPGGELTAIDPGSFGGLQISQAMTLDGGPGRALILSPSDGIAITAGPNDVVTLRHLQLRGSGGGFSVYSGIRFSSGKALILDDVTIEGFPMDGILVQTAGPTSVTISNSRIYNNGQDGVALSPSSGAVQATISNSKIYDNGRTGLAITPSTSTVQATVTHSELGNNYYGLIAQDGADVNLTDSVVAGSTSIGVGCQTFGNGPCTVQTESDRLDHNWAAIWMNHGAGNGQITETLSNDAVFSNSYGIYGDFGGTLNAASTGNNRFVNNFVNGAASSSVTLG